MVAAPEPLFDSILKVHIAPHLFTMALDPVANFVLQRAISQAHTEEQVIYHPLLYTYNYW